MLKIIIAILLLAIVVSLFSGLFFLVKDQGKTRRVANSLALRVTLAILLIVIIFVATQTGHLHYNPSPIPAF